MFSRFLSFFTSAFDSDNNKEIKVEEVPSIKTHNVLGLYWNHEFCSTHKILPALTNLGITISYQLRTCPALICFVPKKFILLDLRSNTSSSENFEDLINKLPKCKKPISQVLIDTTDPENYNVVLALYSGEECISILSPQVSVAANHLTPYTPTEKEKNFGPAKTHEFV